MCRLANDQLIDDSPDRGCSTDNIADIYSDIFVRFQDSLQANAIGDTANGEAREMSPWNRLQFPPDKVLDFVMHQQRVRDCGTCGPVFPARIT